MIKGGLGQQNSCKTLIGMHLTMCLVHISLVTITISYFVASDIVFLQPCHVVYTEFRPTPLQHYIYPAGADGLYLVVDEKVHNDIIIVMHVAE